MNRGFQQVKFLLRFIAEDCKLQHMIRDMTRINLCLQIVRKLKTNETTLKQVEAMKTDIYSDVIDAIEDVRGTIEMAKELETCVKRQERKVSNIAHDLIDCTVTQMAYKIQRGREDELTPVEIIFCYDNMGHLGKRLSKYQCCSLVLENATFEKFRGIKQNCTV